MQSKYIYGFVPISFLAIEQGHRISLLAKIPTLFSFSLLEGPPLPFPVEYRQQSYLFYYFFFFHIAFESIKWAYYYVY